MPDLPIRAPDYSKNELTMFVEFHEEKNASGGQSVEFSSGEEDDSLSMKVVILEEIRERACSSSVLTASF